jgi:rubrerythrin
VARLVDAKTPQIREVKCQRCGYVHRTLMQPFPCPKCGWVTRPWPHAFLNK